MITPYRQAPSKEASPPKRRIDPWFLALSFAWVCDAVRIGFNAADHRSSSGELGFAALLALTTLIVAISWLRRSGSRA